MMFKMPRSAYIVGAVFIWLMGIAMLYLLLFASGYAETNIMNMIITVAAYITYGYAYGAVATWMFYAGRDVNVIR